MVPSKSTAIVIGRFVSVWASEAPGLDELDIVGRDFVFHCEEARQPDEHFFLPTAPDGYQFAFVAVEHAFADQLYLLAEREPADFGRSVENGLVGRAYGGHELFHFLLGHRHGLTINLAPGEPILQGVCFIYDRIKLLAGRVHEEKVVDYGYLNPLTFASGLAYGPFHGGEDFEALLRELQIARKFRYRACKVSEDKPCGFAVGGSVH